MTQPAAQPAATPAFEDISYLVDDPPRERPGIRGFVIDRGPGACIGYVLLAVLALALLVAEVWGAWISIDMMASAAWHQWHEWH